jgi:hypothetical protein
VPSSLSHLYWSCAITHSGIDIHVAWDMYYLHNNSPLSHMYSKTCHICLWSDEASRPGLVSLKGSFSGRSPGFLYGHKGHEYIHGHASHEHVQEYVLPGFIRWKGSCLGRFPGFLCDDHKGHGSLRISKQHHPVNGADCCAGQRCKAVFPFPVFPTL